MTEAVVFLRFIMTGGVPIFGESKFTAISDLRKNKFILMKKKQTQNSQLVLGVLLCFLQSYKSFRR